VNETRKMLLTVGVIMVIALIMLGVEWLLRAAGRLWLVWIVLCLVVLVVLLGMHFAGASP
jgi:hypothetical protein